MRTIEQIDVEGSSTGDYKMLEMILRPDACAS